MIYLLAKFTVIFLLACILSFMFGYWWVRRRFVDVTDSYSSVSDIDKSQSPTFDINKVIKKIEQLESAIKNTPIPRSPNTVNLVPLTEKVNDMETMIKGFHLAHEADGVNFQALQLKINAIEKSMIELLKHNTNQARAFDDLASLMERPEAHEPPKPVGESNKDDLKKIWGVGPKLEKLLNSHGIHYFRQIASWGPKEIEEIDNQLKVFKGRITRDDWVGQAKALDNES